MGDEFDRTIFIMETPPGPPAGRPRWYCYEREPGFDTPEEGVSWALKETDLVMVHPLEGPYYWAGSEPREWDAEENPLQPWPPSPGERRAIDRAYEATVERYAEADKLAPRLVQEVVRQLEPALPDGWSIEAVDDAVVLKRLGRTVGGPSLAVGDLELIYFGLLDGIQSEISEETTDAWPHDETRGMHMWEPEVRLIDDEFRAWYGPEEDPVLAMEPIALADLRRG